jgi:hypothetical protein
MKTWRPLGRSEPETDKGAQGAQQSPHTEEPVEGSDEEVDTPGAEQARDDD